MTPESDRELNELLAATAAARQRLRAESATEVPPPHIDAAILAAARRAVSARPTLVGRSPWRRWQVPLAAAAVLVVATSLSLMVDRGSEPGSTMEPHLDAPGASPPAALSEYRTPPSTTQDMDTARPADGRARAQEPASKDSTGARSAEKEMAPAELTDVPRSKVAANRAEVPPPTARGAEAETASAADPVEAKAAIQNQVLAPPPAQPASVKQELRQATESMAPMERDRAAAGKADSGASAAPAASEPPKAAAPASLAKRRLKLSSEEILRFAEREPERALAAIREVWEDGQHESARAMLADFLQKQPGYPLPPDYPVPRPAADQLKERSPEGR